MAKKAVRPRPPSKLPGGGTPGFKQRSARRGKAASRKKSRGGGSSG